MEAEGYFVLPIGGGKCKVQNGGGRFPWEDVACYLGEGSAGDFDSFVVCTTGFLFSKLPRLTETEIFFLMSRFKLGLPNYYSDNSFI
jgi:hypothetical protein